MLPCPEAMPWLAVGLIPIAAPAGLPDGERADLGRGVQLVGPPGELSRLEGPGLTREQLGWLVPHVRYVLACPYELEVDPGRLFGERQREISDRLMLANLAVWLANRKTDLRFRYVAQKSMKR